MEAAPIAVVCAAEGDVAALHRHKRLPVWFVERPGELLHEEVQLHAMGEVLGSSLPDECLFEHEPLSAAHTNRVP